MRPARLLVLHPPMSVARDFIDYPYASDLGAVQLAATLGAAGHDVALVDAFALPGSTLAWRADGRAHLGAPVGEVVDRAEAAVARGTDALVVALTPFHRPPLRDDVLGAVLAGLRSLAPDHPLWLADAYQSGQHYVEADGDAVLAAYPEVDGWVKYEAEVTLPEMVAALGPGAGRSRGVLRGVTPETLDELPPAAWDRIDLAARDRFSARVIDSLGRSRWPFPIDGRTLPFVTSRGCPFTCVHCSSNPGRQPGLPKTQRRLSAARLRADLARLRALGATRVFVLDELLNVNEAHFDAFLQATADLGLGFEIPNGMRADYLEPRHFALMKGRTTTVSVSAESGVQRVVTEVVGKRLDLSAIVRAAGSAQEAGVPLMIHYMIGLPGETAREVNGTLAFATDLHERFGALPAVQFATPLPGTALAAGRQVPGANASAPGGKLPVVSDWGPLFQTEPSPDARSVSPELLRRFKWTFDERLRHAQGPKKLIMNVTYVCNNHCTFCAVGTRTQVHGHPPRQREHLEHYARQGVRMVDFDGGEPTLNDELVPLIEHARALGYERVNVTTNGRLCAYPEFAGKLVRSGLTSLLFSVHGPDAQTHAQQVGVAEAFDQTVAGIKHARAAAPPGVELGMNVTVTKGNWQTLGGIAHLAWDLGLPWLNIQFLTPFGRATRWVAPDTAAAAGEAMRVIDRWRDRMKIQIINLPFCFMPGYESFMMGDLAKLERHMVFVNNEDVNLGAYLALRRTRKPVCAPCPHAVFCGGFYEMDDVPEPPWLVTAEDLVRPRAAATSSSPPGSPAPGTQETGVNRRSGLC